MDQTIGSTVLNLHADISNLGRYQGNTALMAALLDTAECKAAQITAFLADARLAAGLPASPILTLS